MNVYEVPFHFNNQVKFGYKDGFNLAFSFTDVTNPQLLDKKHGHFKAELIKWKFNNKNNPEIENIELELHKCSRGELGLEEDGTSNSQATFYPIAEAQKSLFKVISKTFFCFDDPSLIELAGGIDT